jgi:uncharacterized membrane protein
MTDPPLLSPRQDVVDDTRTGTPLALLAYGYPPGAASSNIMLFIIAPWLLVSSQLIGYAGDAQATSDRISAVLVILLGMASLVTRRAWLAWLAGCIGLWLIAAPVLLWSPSLGAYLSSTIAGILVAAEGLVIPMSRRLPGPDVPEGWSYNPSAWPHRIPVILLASASFLIAAYMAAFQLGYIERVWDPVFGGGTMRVLTSEVSRAWPVSDAALGAATYLIDLVMVCTGDQRRWRTMPWVVLVFGVLVVPVGVVSVVLIILQPLVVGAWCAWCLVTASATLTVSTLALDEVAATLQLLRHVRRSGRSWWSVLWHGTEHGATPERLAPRQPNALPPWSLWLVALAGVWVMFEPAVLGMSERAAGSAYLSGALLIVVAVIAMSEIARPLRFLAMPIAAWIMVAPWCLAGASAAARFGDIVVGLVVLAASFPRGKIGERRGHLERVSFWPSRSAAEARLP